MLLLMFGGLVVLAELCVLSWHETRRNQRALNDFELQDYWYHEEQRAAADGMLATVFPTPTPADSEEDLESLALLTTSEPAGRWADLGDRLM
jgi:hypothetical protein